jgi:tRNA-guanine family transglycosylase
LSGGESKDSFWRVVSQCASKLPENKPRYLMGVGYAVDLVVCSALGVDMFDCVYPSRTARFGTALVPTGTIHLKSSEFAKDYTPLDSTCNCMVCMKYTKAYLHTIVGKEQLGAQLLTYHNIAYQMNLMKSLRDSLLHDNFVQFVLEFMKLQYPNNNYPKWTRDALEDAGINL